MIGSRFYLVLVRLVVASTGAVLAAFKFIKPEATPAFLALPEFGSPETRLPWETNPIFAKALLALFLAASLGIIFFTIFDWVRERAKYGYILPVAGWPTVAILFIGVGGWFWYALVALATDSYWGFVFSMGVISAILFIYELAGLGDKK